MRVLFKLRLPHALPHIFVGLKIAAGASVVGALVGETFAGSSALGAGGLGYNAIYALSQLATPYLFALILTSSLLGLLFFLMVTTLERLLVGKWHESVLGDRMELHAAKFQPLARSPRVDEVLPIGGDLIMAAPFVLVVARNEVAILDHEFTLDDRMPRRHRALRQPRLQYTVRTLSPALIPAAPTRRYRLPSPARVVRSPHPCPGIAPNPAWRIEAAHARSNACHAARKFDSRDTASSARRDGAESVLKLTHTPAALILPTGATRPVPSRLRDGQWHTPVPHLARDSIS